MKRSKRMGVWILLFCLTAAIVSPPVKAETLEDLSRRVRALEQAVMELQAKCAACSNRKNESGAMKARDIWTCQVTGRRKIFYGNGKSKGLAERDAMEQCQQVSNICRLKECSQE